MKQHVLGSLTAAFVVAAVGAPLPSHAQTDDSDPRAPLESSDTSDVPVEADPASSEVSPEVFQATIPTTANESSALDSNPDSSPGQAFNTDHQALAADDNYFSILPHPLDERQAATLYVQSIPVLTFLGDELESLSGDKGLSEADAADHADSDPVIRANQVRDALEEFRLAAGSPDAIVARWNADQEQYVVAIGDAQLVGIDGRTILPDTTEEPAEDVLHAANRLRRLMGGADPLEEVIGRPQPQPQQIAVRSTSSGMASWYGPGFHGRRSASGEVFNQNALTAAHRTLPFGTRVRVTNIYTQQQVVVRINDRGPFSHNRVIDLSAAAAQAIGIQRSGVGPVRIEVLAP